MKAVPTGLTGQAASARAPEELEALFEDALVLRDAAALATLFTDGATLVSGEGSPVRGRDTVARAALQTWRGDRVYVAAPRRVVLARDLALIVADGGVNVARREADGAWRYVIVCQLAEGFSDRRTPCITKGIQH